MHEVLRTQAALDSCDGKHRPSTLETASPDTAEYIGKFVNQLNGDEYMPALQRSAATASTRSTSTARA